jgi:DNA-binding NarL/FixJ family response regulator
MRLRCLIVDDHPLMRGALRNSLEALSDTLQTDLAGDLSGGLRHLSAGGGYDIVLLDLQLPDSTGTAGLETLRKRFPDARVLVISGHHDRGIIERCIQAGACGFLPKIASSEKLSTAIRTILKGDIYLPPDLDNGFDRVRAAQIAARTAQSSDPRQLGLTDRQCAVLKLIVEGFPNKVIGRELELAEGTVKVHVSAVLRALGVRNRTQAALAANRLGLRWRN